LRFESNAHMVAIKQGFAEPPGRFWTPLTTDFAFRGELLMLEGGESSEETQLLWK